MSRRSLLSIAFAVIVLSGAIRSWADDPVRGIQGEWPNTCGCWVWHSPQSEGNRTVFFTFDEQRSSDQFVPKAVLGFVSGDQELNLFDSPDSWWGELPATARYRNREVSVTVSLIEVPPTPEALKLMEELDWDGDCSVVVTGTLEVSTGEDPIVVQVEGRCGC